MFSSTNMFFHILLANNSTALANHSWVGFMRHSTLTRLSLCKTGLGDDAGLALADTLCLNTTLRDLDLSWNDLGDGGARALAPALRRNTTLTSLELQCNGILEDGMLAMADGMRLHWHRESKSGIKTDYHTPHRKLTQKDLHTVCLTRPSCA